MKMNIGKVDSIIRLIAGVILISLFFGQIVQGTLGYIVLAIGCVLTLTSLIRRCPLYALLDVNTCSAKRK